MYILPGALAPLANYRQFILVRFVPRPGEAGKTDKHPINPRTLKNHDAHDSTIWLDIATAAALADRLGDGYGVGFTITAADPFICLDLDECATLNGGWTPEALTMLAEFPGACELSNSGRGLHVWAQYQGVAPEHGKKSAGTLKKKWLELYTELRFIALGSSASGTMHDLTAHLPGFIAKWFPPHAAQGDDELEGWTTAPVADYSPLTDDELIAKATARSTSSGDAGAVFGGAPTHANFIDLWARDVSVLSRVYPAQMAGKEFDGSDADFALAKELAYWTGKDCERVERLMNASAMKRDKWDERRRDTTYLRETVLRGVGACVQVHKVKPVETKREVVEGYIEPTEITHSTYVFPHDYKLLFTKCIYVQDLNAALLSNGDIVDQARFKARLGGYCFVLDAQNAKSTKDAWEAFLHNQVIMFPRAEGTAFDPAKPFQWVTERAGRTWVNVYNEPLVDKRQGDVTPFMNLIKKLLPHGDDALILLSYMAAVCQHKGVKFKWAPFIQGTQGNGKSTIVKCLRHALGFKYIFSVKADMIENNFNGWLENNLLYVADDIYSHTDRSSLMEALKSLITEEDQPITLKGIDSIQKSIIGNFIFTDNHKDGVKTTDESRRICPLYCAQQSKFDRMRDGLTRDYFAKEFYPWLEKDGFAHVAHMLYTMDIDPRYNPAGDCKEAPESSVRQEAIVDGRTGLEHEVAEWIELDEPGFCGDFVSVHMLKRKLETMPRYAKSASPLKIKEMMGRLGYEVHRSLPEGRSPVEVMPDNTRPILYVSRDCFAAEIKDAATVAQLYASSQQAALTAAVAKRFQMGGV